MQCRFPSFSVKELYNIFFPSLKYFFLFVFMNVSIFDFTYPVDKHVFCLAISFILLFIPAVSLMLILSIFATFRRNILHLSTCACFECLCLVFYTLVIFFFCCLFSPCQEFHVIHLFFFSLDSLSLGWSRSSMSLELLLMCLTLNSQS